MGQSVLAQDFSRVGRQGVSVIRFSLLVVKPLPRPGRCAALPFGARVRNSTPKSVSHILAAPRDPSWLGSSPTTSTPQRRRKRPSPPAKSARFARRTSVPRPEQSLLLQGLLARRRFRRHRGRSIAPCSSAKRSASVCRRRCSCSPHHFAKVLHACSATIGTRLNRTPLGVYVG